LEKLGERTDRGSCTSRCFAAENHDGSRSEVLLLVDAQFANAGAVKSGRDKRVRGVCDRVILLLRLCGESAKAQQRQKDTGQDYKQAN